MSASRTLAILFADISGSTALYDRLGNDRARKLVADCLAIMVREADSHGGTLIKTIGDEILCTFPDAPSALRAARAMQLAVELEQPDPRQPMYIRVGLHFGEVLLEAGDVFGDAVNVAARVAAITRARQIMTTRAVVDALPDELKRHTRPILRAEFRGKHEAMEVFLVFWEQDDTLATRIGMPQFRKPNAARHELIVRYGGHIHTVDEQHRSMVVGRGDQCDIVVDNAHASRQHARIEFSFNKFLLIDHSSNGSYVRFNDGHVIPLAHEQLTLHGSGSISLGAASFDQPAQLIEFIVQ